MFRYAIVQILWALPKLLATSLFLFFVTTLIPDRDSSAAQTFRFVDLPPFINLHARDVRDRSLQALAHVAQNDAQADSGAHELCRLGGAALPVVLPLLESLAPEPRGRVAMALAPVAQRMGLATPASLEHAETAALFWTRFWEQRALDFTQSSAEREVGRLVDFGSDSREQEVIVLDTFALQALMRAMAGSIDRPRLERATRLARHATERGLVVDGASNDMDIQRAVADWHEWWFAHESHFITLEGAKRIRAMVIETQYGKWISRIANGELGVSAVDRQSVATKLRARGPVTLLICTLASLLGCLFAIALGLLRASREGRPAGASYTGLTLAIVATPTFAIAGLLRHAVGPHGASSVRIALAVVALSLSSAAMLSNWQYAAVLEAIRADYVTTARARGFSVLRVAWKTVCRAALIPMVTLAGLGIPSLLGGSFVVEEVFGVPGLGYETLRALDTHDTAWLMAIMLVSSLFVSLGLVVGDIAHAALDSRVRDSLFARHGGQPAK